MKKLLCKGMILLITLVFMVSLTGCKGSAEDISPNKDSTSVSDPSGTQTPSWTPISYENRYGYKSLSQEHKAVYDKINTAALDYSRFIELDEDSIESKDFMRILRHYIDDHPEVFWITAQEIKMSLNANDLCSQVVLQFVGKTGMENYDQKTSTLKNEVSVSELNRMRKEFDKNIEEILTILSPADDELTRELKLYNYVAENVRYNAAIINQADPKAGLLEQSAYGAAVDRVSAFAGHSKLFAVLLTSAGIECMFQFGEVQGEKFPWNVVRLDGKYYNVDPIPPKTMVPGSGNVIDYSFFNVPDKTIQQTHTIMPVTVNEAGSAIQKGTQDFQLNYKTPACTSSDKSFDTLFGVTVSDSFNEKDFSQKIQRLYDCNMSGLYLSFTGTEKALQNYLDTHLQSMVNLASPSFVLDRQYHIYSAPGGNKAYFKLTGK
jgi:hypothetical protein